MALLAAGCRTSAEAQSADDAQADIPTDEPVTTGSRARGEPRTTGVPSGPSVVSYPGFEVLPDGRSVVTVQVRGPVNITEQKAEGRIVYVLSGVAVPDKVNTLPLLTQHFPSQVTSVTIEQTPGGALLLIDLREPSKSTFKVHQNEAGNLVTISLPRSERWGSTDPANDPTNFEQPTESTDTSSDFVEDSSADGAPEDYKRERERRRRKSKRQPKPYVMRPLTLPHKTIAPDISVSAGGFGARDQRVFLASGIRWGIIDQVEIEVTPNAFRLSPNPAYVFPSLGITAGYTGHTFEIAGRARYFVGVDSDSGVTAGALLLGVPMAIHLSRWGRIDTGAFVTLDFENSLETPLSTFGMVGGTAASDFAVGLFNTPASPLYFDSGIPFHFLFQPVEEFWFGVHHGLTILDFENASETIALPLGAEIGLTASNDYNPTADLGFRIDLPMFIVPGRDDVIEEDAYELGVWFRWYHHL